MWYSAGPTPVAVRAAIDGAVWGSVHWISDDKCADRHSGRLLSLTFLRAFIAASAYTATTRGTRSRPQHVRPKHVRPKHARQTRRRRTGAMLPLHLASGDGGVHSTTDRGQEPAPNPGPEPHAQHDGPAPVATGSTDATERHARTRITQSDWNIHRETIVYLYRDRMQPLNQVRETMEREYGFFAT